MKIATIRQPRFWLLLAGDIVALALVTIFGFATHDELGSGIRMLTTFLPLVIAWLLIAPHLGVFDLRRVADPLQLWRPFWAMILAGPLAAWLRAVMLGAAILPIFVIVLGGISATGLLLWRAIFWFLVARKNLIYG